MAEASMERVSGNAVTHGGDSERGTELTQSKSCTNNERNERELTVMVEIEGEDEATAMEWMRCVRELCGGLLAYITHKQAPGLRPLTFAQRHRVRSELVPVKQPVSDKQDTVFKNQVEKKAPVGGVGLR
ncbi:unnamed protein product [Pleuronectes platessa]|uniref:Uncharacterized protein n=1 Tax=Pleuronectes platessa TaxID=8262 RepID=A0A9N7YRW9_PLEPL|nr:unnamed protein product [Pleuronectes platessa]